MLTTPYYVLLTLDSLLLFISLSDIRTIMEFYLELKGQPTFIL